MHHFRSKAELFAAAIGYLADRQLAEIRAATPTTREERLAAIRAAMSGPVFQAGLELWMAARTDEALRAALLPSQREIGRAVREVLGPEFADRAVYESLLMLLRGLALTSVLRDDPELADEILARWLAQVPR